jgi:hypothetical protein
MKGKLLLVLTMVCLVMPWNRTAAQKPYRGAEYRTIASMTYGRFEVRMKTAGVSGMLASFFTYYDPASPWNEIDVENMGRYTNESQFNTIVPANGINHVQRQLLPFNPHAGFHTYGIEWTPEYVAWQIDGDEVYRQTESHVALLTKPQKIMMNIWQPSDVNWAGSFTSSQLPVYAYYDWVKYYSYTPGSGDNFALQWTDDFSTFDTQRWQKATHTWDGNNAQFVTENAVLKDGYLVLCLTSNSTSGYSGGTIPNADTDAPYPVGAWGYDSTIVLRFSEQVDAASAETVGNYFGGSNVTYKNARLRPDSRTVDIAVGGMNLSVPFILFSQGVKDLASPANTMSLKTTRVVMPLSFPITIDVGGPGGSGFLADSSWTATKQYGYVGGSPFLLSAGTSIANTAYPAIYRSSIHGLAGYKVRVPNGKYNVTLMLVEDMFSSAGKRVFSAKVEGQQVFANIDLFQQAGQNAAVAIVAQGVTVEDNLLDLWLGASMDSTTLAGIVVERDHGATGVRQEGGGTCGTSFSIYPNPMNLSATFHIDGPGLESARIAVYDLLGREVSSIDLGMLAAGVHEVQWSANFLASGVYYCALGTSGGRLTKRVLLMK